MHKMKTLRFFLLPSLLKGALAIMALFNFGCAILHHVQLGQIDNRSGDAMIPFEIMMSETGVSVEEIGKIAKSTRSQGGDNAAGVAQIISLFQMGSRTGNPVYNQRYAEKLVYEIHQKCPSGRVTGLVSIREMRKYPVISGEIVKVTGFCRKTRIPASVENSMEEGEI